MSVGVSMGFTPESLAKIRSMDRAAVTASVRPAVNMWTADMLARLRTRSSRITGRYAGSWLGRVIGTADGVAFVNIAKYSRYVEEGTRPHVIMPRTAKVLFWRPGRGRVSAFRAGPAAFKGGIFARKVNHPGSRPRWTFRDTFAESRARFFQFLRYQLAKNLPGREVTGG